MLINSKGWFTALDDAEGPCGTDGMSDLPRDILCQPIATRENPTKSRFLGTRWPIPPSTSVMLDRNPPKVQIKDTAAIPRLKSVATQDRTRLSTQR